jgi:aryl-alcohol dehydrogenase-like predicted oxidoreductase
VVAGAGGCDPPYARGARNRLRPLQPARQGLLDRDDLTGHDKLHRLEENLAAADLELTPGELREIDEIQIEAQGARYSEANQGMIDR